MWQEQTPFVPYDDETAHALKLLFAGALLRHPHNPGAAAREIEPTGNQARAHWMLNEWQNDPVVIAEMVARRAELGAKAGLPTKEEFALRVFEDGQEISDKETRLKYMRTFAEVMGYIEKGGGININNANNVVNQPKIMRVPMSTSDDQWEAAATAHHRKLISDH